MKVLALNAFHGGSHRAFLDGWTAHSRHEFTVLTLPPRRWKWRMRHSPVTFAAETDRLLREGRSWDVVFCTDMLGLAEFRGLVSEPIPRLPAIAYFHENQLTYPSRAADGRDLHLAFSNLTTALAATRVWFNTAYHRDDFLTAAEELLRRMPDHRPLAAIESIRQKSDIQPPGVALPGQVAADDRPRAGPLRVVWVSRWEHDKDPETFFEALSRLAARGIRFRLNVLGESFDERPECFDTARSRLAPFIDRWGYLADPGEYARALAESDVVVSTARHEFFGIGVLEAVAAGCRPLVPRALSYPEVLGDDPDLFHDGTAEGLAAKLAELAVPGTRPAPRNAYRELAGRVLRRFGIGHRAAEMDAALARL